MKHKPMSIDLVNHYKQVIEKLKVQTMVEGGITIPVKNFTKDNKVPSHFLLILSSKFNILKCKMNGANRRTGYTFIWNPGDKEITDNMIRKIHDACSGWKNIPTSLKPNNPKNDKQPVPVTQATDKSKKGTYFSGKHLKILNKLPFETPQQVVINNSIKLEEVKLIEFVVKDSTTTLKAFFDVLSETKTENLFQMDFVNKDFELSPRYQGKESGAYIINTIDHQ